MAEVCVIGLGYIGLPTALAFANSGKSVCGVDALEAVCDSVNRGEVHIAEPGLDDIARSVHALGKLQATTKPLKSDCYIIAVPTPITKEKKADLSYVRNAARSIAGVLEPGNLVVLESTVPPRCTVDILVPELEKSGFEASRDFLVAHCPERVLPGKILHEIVYNNRIIGGIDEDSARAAKDLYSAFVQGDMLLTSSTTAELCKLMENTFRDVNIALANELAMLCEGFGVNAWEVIELANMHPRVNIHQPGPGVGGHCLAVDPWFIVEKQPEVARLIGISREVNDEMPHRVAEIISKNTVVGGKVVLMGVTYKPNIDDMRESPITDIRDILECEGHQVSIVDPFIQEFNHCIYGVAANADTVVLCVNHAAFNDVDLKELASVMRGKLLIDTRNFFEEGLAAEAGLRYVCLGNGLTDNHV